MNALEQKIEARCNADYIDTCDHITGHYYAPSPECIQDIAQIVLDDMKENVAALVIEGAKAMSGHGPTTATQAVVFGQPKDVFLAMVEEYQRRNCSRGEGAH